ncbi:MAG: hypothetical protein ACJ786_32375, partial [Catenulispora sp.]
MVSFHLPSTRRSDTDAGTTSPVDPAWGTPPERATRTADWVNAYHRLFPPIVQHVNSPTTGNWDLTIDCLDGPLRGG